MIDVLLLYPAKTKDKKPRNKTIYKEIYKRDMGVCQCCGFHADEIHHIVPLVLGGTDTIDNMVCICNLDHYHAPNTKEEFIEYQKHGGIKLDVIMGRAINNYYAHPELHNEITLSECIEISRKLINTLREIDVQFCIEKYGVNL